MKKAITPGFGTIFMATALLPGGAVPLLLGTLGMVTMVYLMGFLMIGR